MENMSTRANFRNHRVLINICLKTTVTMAAPPDEKQYRKNCASPSHLHPKLWYTIPLSKCSFTAFSTNICRNIYLSILKCLFSFSWRNVLLQHDFYLVFSLFDCCSGRSTGLPNSMLFYVLSFSDLLILHIFIFTYFISLWLLDTNFDLIWSSAIATAAALR